MIMSDDKKKQATLILSKKNKMLEPVPTDESGAEMDSDMGMVSAAEEIMRAVEAKDAKMLKEALKSFYSMCEDCEPEKED
jgi:hypothetical protein